ncbi:acyl-CoA synthetase [Nostoc sp. 3335mG]|nr:acyl-CoA synthetase [Nostoc sp. 3335mG]
MHPSAHAVSDPVKPAIVMASTGLTIDYATLDALANQSAHVLRQLGLGRGDCVASLFDNGAEVFVFGHAVQRTGLYLTSISSKLSAADIAYILRDCGARILVASGRYAALAAQAAAGMEGVRIFAWDRPIKPEAAWSANASAMPDAPVEDQSPGTDMLYSSGTTGRPKGVKFPLPTGPLDAGTPLMAMGTALYGMGGDTIYLSTSPLYHAAPLRWAMTIHRLGGTVIVMERFDAEETLALIERHRITHATFVPTHFIRMLKLPEERRTQHDLSSLRCVVHAAAPCPVPVKQAMIDWWGPIVHEYYSGTEQCGITAISATEWLARPGSVGRAVLGSLRITDDEGRELPVGKEGNVCFAYGPPFEYHNDPEKTAKAYDRNGWATLGDVGRVDEDGFLFLTDRKSFMIISGGVNIYPQEIENCLVTHSKVADVAVIGVPDEEMGECVLAVVQPAVGIAPDDRLAEELCAFAREALGGVKAPRRYEFRPDLPREPTGKLMKRTLIDEYRRSIAGP